MQFKDAVYHVASRGNGGRDIFLDDIDRRIFLSLLKEFCARFNLKIFCFCLMSNHYHLLLITPEANLASAMQWLNTTYTARLKLRHHFSGHILQGRYKSLVVEAEEHWQRLSFYIHLNPVRAGLAEDPAQYEWSSYLDYITSRPRFAWLSREEILSEYGRSKVEQRRRYRRACLELTGKPREFWDDVRDKAIIGSDRFIEKLKREFAPRSGDREITSYNNISRPVLEVEDEVERVAKIFGMATHQLQKRARPATARMTAYWHLVSNCKMKIKTVAQYFGVSSAAVTMGIKQIQAKAFEDPGIEKMTHNLIFKV